MCGAPRTLGFDTAAVQEHALTDNGATESNGVLRGLAGNAAALWSIKAGAAFVSVYAAEKLWRRQRRGQAIAVMIVSNGVLAAVAMNNARSFEDSPSGLSPAVMASVAC